MTIILKVNGISCRGRERSKNEDSICIGGTIDQHGRSIVEEFDVTCHEAIILLADGMGGHDSGEVASRETVTVISDDFFREQKRFDLINSINRCHYFLRGLSSDRTSTTSLGTTIVGITFSSKSIQWFNVGDSRGYLFRDGQLMQLTTDDSFSDPRYAGILTQCLGGNQPNAPNPHNGTDELLKGDIFLLVSDGVTDVVDDIKIADFFKSGEVFLAADLVAIANQNGSVDDTSAIICEVF